MRIKPTGPTKLRILFFLFFLSISFLRVLTPRIVKKKQLNGMLTLPGKQKFDLLLCKEAIFGDLHQNFRDQLKLSATEVISNPGDGSVFISPRVEFAIGNFAYLSESNKAETDYRPSNDGSISLSGSVKLIRYSSDASDLSIKAIFLLSTCLTRKLPELAQSY